jgi:5-hydroxyisourate hydrolase
VSGRLTTHVLDIAQGKPAADLGIALWALDAGGERRLLKALRTNAEGRTDEPLLTGAELRAGGYEIVFAVGEYFASQRLPTSDPPFLEEIPVRFGIANPDAHYHVPLLASPWAYSTYRGS